MQPMRLACSLTGRPAPLRALDAAAGGAVEVRQIYRAKRLGAFSLAGGSLKFPVTLSWEIPVHRMRRSRPGRGEITRP